MAENLAGMVEHSNTIGDSTNGIWQAVLDFADDHRHVAYLVVLEVALLSIAGLMDYLVPTSGDGGQALGNVLAGLIASYAVIMGAGAIAAWVLWTGYKRF